jgi:putative tryptophan/tyrosine transport system substrate-binding protein
VNRRGFITLVGGAVIGWPQPVRAQQPTKIPRIGFLGPTSASHPPIAGFLAGLRDLGYVDGKTIVIEFRWAEEDYDRLAALAAELVRLDIDVLVTFSNPGVVAAKRATKTIPIVIAISGDAVRSGLAESLSRPGVNITGQTFFNPELNAKRPELLKEALPHSRSVGVVCNPNNQVTAWVLEAMMHAAGSLKLELKQFQVRRSDELASMFSAMKARPVDAAVVVEDVITLDHAGLIGSLAMAQRLPTIGFLTIAEAGGLMSYGVDLVEFFHHAAVFVDKIIKGAKPEQLPMEQPTRFKFVINLKTANTLGFTVPSSLLARADEVIE